MKRAEETEYRDYVTGAGSSRRPLWTWTPVVAREHHTAWARRAAHPWVAPAAGVDAVTFGRAPFRRSSTTS